jgi:hypothetical protein
MNWDAVGAIGEILGALVVVFTLVYLAIQVRLARNATADQSRIYRATAVREMILEGCSNDALRMGQTKNLGLEPYYLELAEKTGVDIEEATRLDWGNGYYFWMWWRQYSSTHDAEDRKELEHVIAALCAAPGMRSSWENSPLIRPLIDESFAKFVDETLAKSTRG